MNIVGTSVPHPTFFTLLLHCVVSLIMMLHVSDQAQTFAIVSRSESFPLITLH